MQSYRTYINIDSSTRPVHGAYTLLQARRSERVNRGSGRNRKEGSRRGDAIAKATIDLEEREAGKIAAPLS